MRNAIRTFLLSSLLLGSASLASAQTEQTTATPLTSQLDSILTPKDALTINHRPDKRERLFYSKAVEQKINEIVRKLENKKLAWMFVNCFPNTIDTTVHFDTDSLGHPDTFVYTGDIHAMWLRDSGAQVFPYVQLCKKDKALQQMIAGVIHRQMKCINIDPYANAFNKEPNPDGDWMNDYGMKPILHERKYEIDSSCYPLRLAYEYWKVTGDTSIFDDDFLMAVQNILKTFRTQQRKKGLGDYRFLRTTNWGTDNMPLGGYGYPVKPVGLIASAFRPSDDATVYLFLIPSNFMAVSSLRKAAEMLSVFDRSEELKVNSEKSALQSDTTNSSLSTLHSSLKKECLALADEVEAALKQYAVYQHPKFGPIYAYEVDGFGNQLLMDDANVPSLLAMGYLDKERLSDPIYQNTRRFVWSDSNPFFFHGSAGEGIGGPHVGYSYIWPMSIMMKAFTSQDDNEIRECIQMLLNTDGGTGFMHEAFYRNDAKDFTRKWFAWANTLFGELIVRLVDEGKLDLLK